MAKRSKKELKKMITSNPRLRIKETRGRSQVRTTSIGRVDIWLLNDRPFGFHMCTLRFLGVVSRSCFLFTWAKALMASSQSLLACLPPYLVTHGYRVPTRDKMQVLCSREVVLYFVYINNSPTCRAWATPPVVPSSHQLNPLFTMQ